MPENPATSVSQHISVEFFEAWNAAAQHLHSMAQEMDFRWMRANPNPPLREHLNFRLGNQLFFIQLTFDQGSGVEAPGSLDVLRVVSENYNGHPCLMT